ALALGCVVALLIPALSVRSPSRDIALSGGGRLHREGAATVVVVEERPHLESLLAQLRGAGVRRIEVIAWSGEPDPAVLRALRHRWEVGRQLRIEEPPTSWSVGPLLVSGGGGEEPEVTAAETLS